MTPEAPLIDPQGTVPQVEEAAPQADEKVPRAVPQVEAEIERQVHPGEDTGLAV